MGYIGKCCAMIHRVNVVHSPLYAGIVPGGDFPQRVWHGVREHSAGFCIDSNISLISNHPGSLRRRAELNGLLTLAHNLARIVPLITPSCRIRHGDKGPILTRSEGFGIIIFSGGE